MTVIPTLVWVLQQSPIEQAEWTEDMRKNRNHPEHSTTEIDKYT